MWGSSASSRIGYGVPWRLALKRVVLLTACHTSRGTVASATLGMKVLAFWGPDLINMCPNFVRLKMLLMFWAVLVSFIRFNIKSVLVPSIFLCILESEIIRVDQILINFVCGENLNETTELCHQHLLFGKLEIMILMAAFVYHFGNFPMTIASWRVDPNAAPFDDTMLNLNFPLLDQFSRFLFRNNNDR